MPRAKPRTAPPFGSTFHKQYYGKQFEMVIVELPTGAAGYCVAGKTFTSPSTASNSITGSHVNGWIWWGIEA